MMASRALPFLLMLGMFSTLPASSVAAEAVDLELILAVDVSGSIDEEEARLQRDGYVQAFRHPRIVEAIRHGPRGRIAVAYYEWAGFQHIKIIADWTLIHDAASAKAFADTLSWSLPETARRTAISQAIDYAVPYFDKNQYHGTRRVIDISGDGPNNWGRRVTEARDAAVAAGIIINGLPIINDRPSFYGSRPMPNLDLYYRNCVIGGHGAFIVVANTFKDFAAAILRKLILEIAGRTPPRATPRFIPAAERIAPRCDVGEMRMMDMEEN